MDTCYAGCVDLEESYGVESSHAAPDIINS